MIPKELTNIFKVTKIKTKLYFFTIMFQKSNDVTVELVEGE